MNEQKLSELEVKKIFKQALGDLEVVAGQDVVDDFIDLFSIALEAERENARKIVWPTEEDYFVFESKSFDLESKRLIFRCGIQWAKEWVEANRK